MVLFVKRKLLYLCQTIASKVYYIIRRKIFLKNLPITYKDKIPTTYIMKDREAGFFSLFFQVIGALDYCRINRHCLILDFCKGPYIDKQRGKNWWQYYFDKSTFGEEYKTPQKHVYIDSVYEQHYFSDYGRSLPNEVGHEMINKLGLTPKFLIRHKVKEFIDVNFADKFIVGIHYRGTDKVDESNLIPFEFVGREVSKYNNNFFFVATDETKFLEYMRDSFPGKVLYYDSLRSHDGSPLHFSSQYRNKYKIGEDALIDCLLLSNCNILFRTESNLSRACSFFNPKLTVVNMSEKYMACNEQHYNKLFQA